MPILVDAPESGLGQGISLLGQALGAGLQRNVERNQRQRLIEQILSQKTRKPPPVASASNVSSGTTLGTTIDELEQEPYPEPVPTDLGAKYSPQQLLAATQIDPKIAEALATQNKAIEEREKEERSEIREYTKQFKDISKLKFEQKGLERARELIETGKVNLDDRMVRGIIQAITEDKGFDKIANFFRTPEQKELLGIMSNYVKSKEIGGSNPSTREVLISMQKLATPLNEKSANLRLVDALLKDVKMKQYKGKVSRDLREKGDYTFPQFQKIVEDRTEKYLEALDKESESRFKNQNIPAAPALAQLKKVPPGTPITQDVIGFLKAKGYSKEEGLKKLKELGYQIP